MYSPHISIEILFEILLKGTQTTESTENKKIVRASGMQKILIFTFYYIDSSRLFSNPPKFGYFG